MCSARAAGSGVGEHRSRNRTERRQGEEKNSAERVLLVGCIRVVRGTRFEGWAKPPGALAHCITSFFKAFFATERTELRHRVHRAKQLVFLRVLCVGAQRPL